MGGVIAHWGTVLSVTIRRLISARCRFYPVRDLSSTVALFVEQVEGLQWISGQPPAELAWEGSMRLRVKTRHGPQMRDCLLRLVLPPLPPPLEGNEAAPVAAGESGEHGERATASGPKPALAAAATRGYVNLDTKESALAPGQFAAFYLGDECVGSGVIGGWSAAAAATAAVGVVPERKGATEQGVRSGLGSAKQERKRTAAAAATTTVGC